MEKEEEEKREEEEERSLRDTDDGIANRVNHLLFVVCYFENESFYNYFMCAIIVF